MPKQNDEDTILLRLANLAKKHTVFIKDYQKRVYAKIEINGNELNTWIIKPRNFNPKKKYPLLMFQYSGPGSQQVANRWGDPRSLWHKYLANQ